MEFWELILISMFFLKIDNVFFLKFLKLYIRDGLIMEKTREPQCFNCLHKTQKSGCGTCASENLERVKKVLSNGTSMNDSVNQDLVLLKYTCKVVMQDPSDFDVVNPLDCKYFMPNIFKIRTA